MDPLSITASIIAVLQMTSEVVKYGLDFAGAPKAILSLKGEVESLHHLLELLQNRCERAQCQKPPPPWLRVLSEVQLKTAVEEAFVKLNPTKEWKKSEAYQRITWHSRKDKFDEIQNTINRYLVKINVILTLKDDATIEETRDRVKEGNEYNRHQFTQLNVQVTQLNDHMTAFEKHQNEEEEKRRQEKEEAEREEITNWLSPFSFIAKQDELLDKSFTDVGEFLWSDQRFQAWAEGRRPWYLWGVGDLGVGKTVLASILAHHLALQSSPGSIPPLILSVYLDYKSSQTQTVEHLVGSLLQQLLQLNESLALPDELKAVHKTAKRLGKKSSSCYKDVRRVLTNELKRFDRIYLIVDGFDELAPDDRPRFLQELRNLKPNEVSILLTSRRFSDETGSYSCRRCLREGLKLVFHCSICGMGQFDICYDCRRQGFRCDDEAHELVEPYKVVEVPVKFPDGDIQRFVTKEIGVEVEHGKVVLTDERDTAVNPMTTPFQDFFHGDPSLPGQIITEVTKKAAGRFLYARLYLDALKTSLNRRMLKNMLRTFPETTADIYREAMQRIQMQEPPIRSRGFRVLGILTHARKTLGLRELKHALAVLTQEDGKEFDDSEKDLEDSTDETKTILGSTSSLVVVEANQASLVHKSLEEYLLQEKNSSKWLPNAHFDLARACMFYLQLVLPSKDCQDGDYNPKNAKFPFLQYASQYWGDHIRDASQDPEHARELQDKALRLLGDSQRMNACMQTAWFTNPGGIDTWDVWKGVDRLHICARFGLCSVISEMDPEPGTVDKEEPKYSQTPLMYACRQGHFEVVELLLRKGASQKKISARGRTALFEAILGHHSRSGAKTSGTLSRHAKVVELLVLEMPGDLDINMTHSQDHDRTALMLAAQKGHLEMIGILLKHPSIGIDVQDAYGATAMLLAVREGHCDIVERLLKVNANIEIVDFQEGRSALRCAAERDSAKIVELLLRHNADPNVKDREGGTAILRAVNRGAARVLEEMMNQNVDIECVDEDGQSLLHGAARNGYDNIARMLLNEKVLSVDVRDRSSMTPLHDASRYGKAAVAAVLLENEADASLEDHFGRTPFIVAWQYGKEDIMRMLAGTGLGQQSPIPLDDSNLPLWAMARRGLTDLLAAAIKSRPQDLYILEPYSEKSPLHCAIEANEPAILDILLQSQDVLPLVNQRNHFGRTPLHIAAVLGDILASQRLISAGADLNTKDRWNDRPIALAQANGHLDVMLVLIKADVNNFAVDKCEIDLKPLFFFAVEKGDVDAVERLIGVYGVDKSVQNSEGLRAIKIAEAADDEEMRLLVAAPTVYVGIGEEVNGRNGEAKTYGREMPFVPFRSRPVNLSG